MKVLELEDATAPLSTYASDPADLPLIVTVGGRPVAALTSLEGSDWESIALSLNPRFIDLLQRARARAQHEGTRSLEDVRRDLGLGDRPSGR